MFPTTYNEDIKTIVNKNNESVDTNIENIGSYGLKADVYAQISQIKQKLSILEESVSSIQFPLYVKLNTEILSFHDKLDIEADYALASTENIKVIVDALQYTKKYIELLLSIFEKSKAISPTSFSREKFNMCIYKITKIFGFKNSYNLTAADFVLANKISTDFIKSYINLNKYEQTVDLTLFAKGLIGSKKLNASSMMVHYEGRINQYYDSRVSKGFSTYDAIKLCNYFAEYNGLLPLYYENDDHFVVLNNNEGFRLVDSDDKYKTNTFMLNHSEYTDSDGNYIIYKKNLNKPFLVPLVFQYFYYTHEEMSETSLEEDIKNSLLLP